MTLPLWINFFEDLQHVRGRSLNTVMAYRRDLELYQQFRTESPTASVQNFYEFMRKQKLSPRSQARVISSLRTYFKFCETHGEKCPELRELKPPKVKVSLPKTLTLAEFHSLYQSCQSEDIHRTARNQLTLLFLFGLGCRVTELIGLNIQDFSPTERWVKVKGKGSKERLIPLTEQLYGALIAYLKEARPFMMKDSTQSILINDRGNRPSRVDVWRWLAAWSAKAGFDEPVNPHRFRHGCATALLEQGADLRSIQVLLGHASIQTTQIYTNVTTQAAAKAIQDHHPLSQLKSEESAL